MVKPKSMLRLSPSRSRPPSPSAPVRTQRNVSATPRSPSSPFSGPVPPITSLKCLVPIESPLTHEAELSARHVVRRSPEHFEFVLQETTWLLNQALPTQRHKINALDKSVTPRASNHTGELLLHAKTRRQVVAQSQRAYAHFRLGQFAAATRDWDACVSLDPTASLLLYNRGCAHYAMQKLEHAIQDFTRALKLDCKNLLFLESRAMVLKELGRFQEAIQDYTWLGTLRQMAHSRVPSSPSGGTSFLSPSSPLPVTDGAASLHGSFSISFTDLQVSLMGAVVMDEGDSAPSETPFVSEGQNTVEREMRAQEWLTQFLQHSTERHTRAELAKAGQLVKGWSFFRGMDAVMIEQCLEDAGFASYDAEQMIIHQGKCADKFHVVLNPVVACVRNVVSRGGISKQRELRKLSQGDTVGTDAFAVSFADGRLTTLRQHMTNSHGPPSTRFRSLHSHHGSILSTQSLLKLLAQPTPTSATVSSSDDDEVDSLLSASVSNEPSFLPPEPASFTSLEPIHCLTLDVEAYRDILHDHEESVLEERMQFLKGCRVFQGCGEDVLLALAAVSGAKVYDPGKNILRIGDVVTQLYVIKRGVCQVRKTLCVPAHKRALPPPVKSSQKKIKRRGEEADHNQLSARSNSGGDGSWVLDNGWMLTNPRLVSNAQNGNKHEPMIWEDVNIAILASGQVFGELSVLQPGQSSQVTIHSQTLVEILMFEQADLARLNIQYHSGPMNALQESLLFHNPPQQKIIQLQRDVEQWEKQKKSVLSELSLHLPTKAQTVLQGAMCMAPKKPAKKLSPAQTALYRRNSLSPLPKQLTAEIVKNLAQHSPLSSFSRHTQSLHTL